MSDKPTLQQIGVALELLAGEYRDIRRAVSRLRCTVVALILSTAALAAVELLGRL